MRKISLLWILLIPSFGWGTSITCTGSASNAGSDSTVYSASFGSTNATCSVASTGIPYQSGYSNPASFTLNLTESDGFVNNSEFQVEFDASAYATWGSDGYLCGFSGYGCPASMDGTIASSFSFLTAGPVRPGYAIFTLFGYTFEDECCFESGYEIDGNKSSFEEPITLGGVFAFDSSASFYGDNPSAADGMGRVLVSVQLVEADGTTLAPISGDSSATAPEPASFLLMSLGALLLASGAGSRPALADFLSRFSPK